MKLATLLRLNCESAGTQSESPDSRASDAWIKDYMENKERRSNEIRQQLQRVRDPEPKEIESAYNNYLPRENFLEKAAEGGRYALVDEEGLLLGTYHHREDAERGQRARIGRSRIVDLGMDHTARPRPLGAKPRVVTLADMARMGVTHPVRSTTSGSGGAAGPGGG